MEEKQPCRTNCVLSDALTSRRQLWKCIVGLQCMARRHSYRIVLFNFPLVQTFLEQQLMIQGCGLYFVLKTLDTIGNCQRPVFSFGVSQYNHKLTNL